LHLGIFEQPQESGFSALCWNLDDVAVTVSVSVEGKTEEGLFRRSAPALRTRIRVIDRSTEAIGYGRLVAGKGDGDEHD
jgi:hypothetical protein